MRRPAALSCAARLRRYGAILLTAQLTLSTSACFTYSRVSPGVVGADEDVRVRVTPAAAIRAASMLGTINEQLEGRLATASDSITVAVWIGRDYVGSPFENVRRPVAFAPAEIIEVRRRQLSKSRTGLALGGLMAATALLITQVVFEPDPNPTDPRQPHPPPDGIRGSMRAVGPPR